MYGYISKPVQMREFLDEIEEVAERAARKKRNGEKIRLDEDDKTGRTDKRNKSGKTNESSKTNGNGEPGSVEPGPVMTGLKNRTGPLLKEINRNMRLLDGSFKKKDPAAVERYANEIKKLSSELGVARVRTAIFKVELAARRGDLARAAEHFAEAVEELSKYEDGTVL